MRCTALIAAAAILTALTSVAVAPAAAQSRIEVREDRAGRVEVREGRTIVRQYVRTDRAPTRFTVRKERSFLDPGTTVAPLSRQYTDYAMPPNYFPSQAFDPALAQRYPLPDNFYLPGYQRF